MSLMSNCTITFVLDKSKHANCNESLNYTCGIWHSFIILYNQFIICKLVYKPYNEWC